MLPGNFLELPPLSPKLLLEYPPPKKKNCYGAPPKIDCRVPPPKKKKKTSLIVPPKNCSLSTSKKLLVVYPQKLLPEYLYKIAPRVPPENCSWSTPPPQKKTTLRAVLSEPTPCPALPSLTVLSLYLPLPEPCHCTLPILPCPSHYTAPQPRFKFPSLYCC